MATFKQTCNLGGPTITMSYDDSTEKLINISINNNNDHQLRIVVSSPISIKKTIDARTSLDYDLVAITRPTYTMVEITNIDGVKRNCITGINWSAYLDG